MPGKGEGIVEILRMDDGLVACQIQPNLCQARPEVLILIVILLPKQATLTSLQPLTQLVAMGARFAWGAALTSNPTAPVAALQHQPADFRRAAITNRVFAAYPLVDVQQRPVLAEEPAVESA